MFQKEKLNHIDAIKLYSIRMREVEENDAAYIFSLRTNSSYNRYISKVSPKVEQQVDYIKSYRQQNAQHNASYYFIIENTLTQTRCGTVRLYNFNDECFEWGSWILDENKPRYAAIETAIFVYTFAFEILGFTKSEFEVNKLNEKVVAYHLRSGAEIISEDDTNFYFRISRETALSFVSSLREKLEAEN